MRRHLRALAETGFDVPFDASAALRLSYVAEVAILLGDADAVEQLYELMSAHQHMTITAGIVSVLRCRADISECWPLRSASSTRRKSISSMRSR